MADRLTYCVELPPDIAPFKPEVDYVLSILDRYYPVERRETGITDKVLRYGLSPDGASVSVPSCCFGTIVTLDGTGKLRFSRNEAEKLISGTRCLFPPLTESLRCQGDLSYDPIGLAFLMFSRIEEWGLNDGDRYDRFPYDRALAVKAGRHGNPVADQALEDVARRLLETENPSVTGLYRVVPTHDVDILKGYHRAHEPLRYAIGDVVKRGNPGRALRRLSAYAGGEPWTSFGRLMEISEKLGLVSHFFFMGPSTHAMDSPYVETMGPLAARVCDLVRKRGHQVGFHPGFATYDDPAEWKRQHQGLSRLFGLTPVSGRQHVLRYAADKTPRIWADNGMRIDYTPAFPEQPGFRTGSTRAFPAFDPVTRAALPVDICATAVMDFGFFGGKYGDVDVETALDRCLPLIEATKYHKGTLVTLQHTGEPLPGAIEFHERVLEAAL